MRSCSRRPRWYLATSSPELRQAFERELGTATRSLRSGERIRIDGYSLRNAISGEGGHGGSFRWSPWTARRPIGIECVRACLANTRLTPVQASHDVITGLVRQADEQRGRPGSLSEWLAGLAVGARAGGAGGGRSLGDPTHHRAGLDQTQPSDRRWRPVGGPALVEPGSPSRQDRGADAYDADSTARHRGPRTSSARAVGPVRHDDRPTESYSAHRARPCRTDRRAW